MSAIIANNAIFTSDSSPTKTPSPSSPTTSLMPTRPYARAPLQPLKYQQYTPIEAPAGMSYAAFLRTWNDDHVARWLNEIKCGCHEDTFKANDIRGDVILELDQITLQEMGVASIGDRLRILNAVKILRQKVSGKSPTTTHHRSNSSLDLRDGHVNGKPHNRRLENGRPAPLQLNDSAARGDLPSIARDPDSARIPPPSQPQPIRPLPMPQQSTPPSSNTPSSAQLTTPNIRANLPPLPPPPRGQPPLPPGSRPNRAYSNSPAPDAPAYTTQPPPPPPNQGLLTPSSGGWHNQHLPSDPRPGNPGGKSIGNRSISPVPPARLRPSGVQGLHARNGSFGTTTTSGSPSKRTVANNSGHPYASAQPAVHHPTSNLATNLSPIDESFNAGSNSYATPTYTVGRGPFVGSSAGNSQTSWDDLRKRIIKFVIPDEGLSFTIDVTLCSGGVEVVEKVLKKFVKSSHTDVAHTEDGGLLVDGWAVFMDMGSEDGLGMPLSEGQLLSICHAPNHPTREHGLVLRRYSRPSSPLSNISNRNTKRASSISILSGLGVRDPERALDAGSISSGRSSPAPPVPAGKKPSKLRNFFGQRPPSELITNHLTEFFPNAEKKVLQRTARNSMMRRRESIASYQSGGGHLSSRFSISTQGSGSRSSNHLQPPPVPDKGDAENLPRVSLSTDDGRSVDLHLDHHDTSTPQHLPPIPFPTESLSESLEDLTHDPGQKRVSRALSTASKRMSYMTELRSKRDRSDTASLMTVDEITAEVESRRASGTYGREDDMDGWTKVDSEIDTMVPKAVADDGADEDEDEDAAAESDESSITSDEEDETLHDEEELSLDVDDDGVIRNVISAKRANKWIKGALIGAGSFGKVYLGMDASSGLLMAVKQVELPTGSGPNQERKKSMLTALEREIELLKNLEHENIVQYLYSSLDNEFLNIFLEYVPGGSVTALLRSYGAFEEPLVRTFVRQILQGLDYLHGRDIIHRDIKGANILVDNKGGVKISDFGISKKVDDNLLTGNRVNRPSLQGSVFWMAPEVVKQSSHTRKADIWSVGCLVVEMLTGEHPWAQLTQMQAIFKIGSSATPTIPSDISSDAQDFLKQTFKIDHEARPGAVELLQHPWLLVKPAK